MPWFRLDDKFHSHPKIIAAGNEAAGLYVRCGAYAADHLTDGFIAEHVALSFGSAELAGTLVRTRLWRRVKGGWQMPDYLDYNPSRKEVLATRAVRAEAGRKGGLASGKTRSKTEANASARASPLLEPPAPPDPRNGSVVPHPQRGISTAARKPGFSSSNPNGAATRQPPPVAQAIDKALHPHGRHARPAPQPGEHAP